MRRIGMRSVLRAVVRLDSVGAVFVALGAAGGLWCAWVVVDRQLGHELDSAAGRSDLVLDLTPMFILASVIGSLGVALRVTSAIRSASTIRLVGRPVGTMLLVAAGVLTALLGGIAVTRDERDETTTPAFDMNAFAEDARLDQWLEPEPLIEPGPLVIDDAGGAVAQEYTLEVHSDGCGVFRTGDIGDDLTWVVKDLDGFQVLGRNATGETQYRFFQAGTFTVVLEAWGSGHHVPVSNVVTVTC